MENKQKVQELDNELKKALVIFNKEVRPLIVNAVNSFINEENNDFYSARNLSSVRELDDMATLVGWVTDNLNGRDLIKSYNGSTTKKIRKALEYIL